jgi:hypothetical protein
MRVYVVGKNTTGHRITKHFLDRICFTLALQLAQVGRLAPAKQLNTMRAEIRKKAHDRAHRPVQIGNVNRSSKPFSATDAVQVKGIMLFKVQVDKVQYGKNLFRHAPILLKTFNLRKSLKNISHKGTKLTKDTKENEEILRRRLTPFQEILPRTTQTNTN